MPGKPEARREKEPADAARHADEPGHHADLVTEPLRHELEHRAVPHSKCQHASGKEDQRGIDALRTEADEDQYHRRDAVHRGEHLDAADAIRERAADWPYQRAHEHAACGEVSGLHCVEPILGVEVDRKRRGETHEAAECHRVEQHEPPRIAHAQHGEIFRPLLRWRCGRAVFRREQIDDERDRHRNRREAEHIVPADGGRECGREERREHRAGVSGAGDPECDALILGRIPARGERQGNRERGARDTEDQPESERS